MSKFTASLVGAIVITLPLAATAPTALAKRPQGINVSQAQKEIDWKLVADKSRFEFAYLRASEGISGVDKFYERNAKEAPRAGIRVGAFHRMYSDGSSDKKQAEDARDEARLFIKTVGRPGRNDLVPMLGVDPPFGPLDSKQVIAWVKVWMNRVEQKMDVRPGIYTSQPIWITSLQNNTYFSNRAHPLWIASRDVAKPLVPADDWSKQGWTVWQKTIGDVQGVGKAINKNVLTYRSVRNLTVGQQRKRQPQVERKIRRERREAERDRDREK